MDQEEPRWLEPAEVRAWIAVVAMMNRLPAALESTLTTHGLNFFEYGVLAALSEEPDGSLRMSQVAIIANGSLSRLSHGARRMEKRGLITRAPDPDDGRWTRAHLTDAGRELIETVAPDHVRDVRSLVFDPLTASDVADLRRIATKILLDLDPAVVEFVNARTGVAAPRE